MLHKYIWLIDIIHNRGPISLLEIQSDYQSHFGGKKELSESTFHRYKKDVMNMFDIDIEYSKIDRGYKIVNFEDIKRMTLRQWLIDTFEVNSILHDNPGLKSRVMLEYVPSGQEHLIRIARAMCEDVTLKMTYQSYFRDKELEIEVEPWGMKLFAQRWYLIGRKIGFHEPYSYSLDRIKKLTSTKRKFPCRYSLFR